MELFHAAPAPEKDKMDDKKILLLLLELYNFNIKNIQRKMIHREGITTSVKDWTMIQASSLVENQEVIQMYVVAFHFVTFRTY